MAQLPPALCRGSLPSSGSRSAAEAQAAAPEPSRSAADASGGRTASAFTRRRRRWLAVAGGPVLAVLVFARALPGFVGLTPASAVAGRPAGRVKVVRCAGQQVTDDKDMLEQLKAWKQAAKSAPPRGDVESKADAPREKASKPKGFGEVVAKSAALEAAAAPLPPRAVTANDAIAELLRRAQQDADPSKLTAQQIIMIFFSFFAGWRDRNLIPGPVELTNTQKQLVILMIQGTLNSVRAARDFWPMLCAELGAGRDPEVKDLVFALTGLRQ